MKSRVEHSSIHKLIVIIAVLLAVVIAAAVVMHKWELTKGVFGGEKTPIKNAEDTIVYNGKKYVYREGVETVLVIGLDTYADTDLEKSYNNNQQSDFLMLIVFDKKAKSYKVLHFDRDTMVEMPVLDVKGNVIDTKVAQAALAHTYGSGGKDSCVNARKAISSFLMDAKIDEYMSFTMDAIKTVNDEVGGVEVTVLNDFSGIDDTLKEGQNVLLTGDHVVNYVHARMGLENDDNTQRMKRQQQYLEALRNKIVSQKTDKGSIADLLLKVNDYLVSDCSVAKMDELYKKTVEYEFKGFCELEGETEFGEFKEFYADGDKTTKLIIDLFCEQVKH